MPVPEGKATGVLAYAQLDTAHVGSLRGSLRVDAVATSLDFADNQTCSLGTHAS